MSKRTTIHPKAIEALKRCGDTSYKSRVNKLWTAEEHAFALLTIWCQIEMRLKLIRYLGRIKEDWPDKLDFIRKNWGPLDCLAKENSVYYAKTFVGDKSMWKLRNIIAHSASQIEKEQAEPLREATEWTLSQLIITTPNKEALLRKKRNSEAQTNRKTDVA